VEAEKIAMFTKFNFQSPIIRGETAPSGSGPPHYRGLAITVRHTTLNRSPLDEESAQRKGLDLTTHYTQRQISMSPVGFEHAIPTRDRPQTHALDSAATELGSLLT
jgi:hypothetical protein